MRPQNMTTAVTVLFVALCALLSGSAHARTWYVNVSGTGDAPTIEAALDSAVVGDTVLVGPGEYTTTGLTVGEGVVVASEMGPLQTRVRGEGVGITPIVFSLMRRAELHGFWISGAYLKQVGTDPDCLVHNNIILGGPGYDIVVADVCTISNNLFLGGTGIVFGVEGDYRPLFHNNIVIGPIYCYSMPNALCNDFVDTTSPCVQTLLADPFPLNFSADPQFCGVEGSNNYYLQSDSPCAEGNAPHVSCGQIGPLPVGCATVNTQAKSWGEVKAMYRE